MTSLEHPLVESYLQDVANALCAVEPERRNEILEQIADHISAATDELAPGDDAGVRHVLDRLGPPADIATAADVTPYGMPSPSAAPAPTEPSTARPSGSSEKWALAAFVVSPITCLIGWVVGVVLLWTSQIWTTRHKIIGTIATLPFALMFLSGGMVFATTARSTSSVSPTPIEATTPVSVGSGSVVDSPTTERAPTTIDDSEQDAGDSNGFWTAGNALTLAAWATLMLIVPIGTLIWLGRALSAALRQLDPHVRPER